jgi:hypothetical protein
MAKRYHDSRVKMLKHREYYAGEEGRRTQEMEDGGMLHEDHSAMANMPQNIIMKHYPKSYGYMPEGLDDGISGVDGLIEKNDRKRTEHNKPKKT